MLANTFVVWYLVPCKLMGMNLSTTQKLMRILKNPALFCVFRSKTIDIVKKKVLKKYENSYAGLGKNYPIELNKKIQQKSTH